MATGFGQVRIMEELYETGTVVSENGTGILVKSSERLQPCSYVVSSETIPVTGDYEALRSDNSQNVAIVGRILTYVNDRNELEVGDAVCAGPNGLAYKMTREEIQNYPDRILGYVAEIPTYEIWRDSAEGIDQFQESYVRNRVWILLK